MNSFSEELFLKNSKTIQDIQKCILNTASILSLCEQGISAASLVPSLQQFILQLISVLKENLSEIPNELKHIEESLQLAKVSHEFSESIFADLGSDANELLSKVNFDQIKYDLLNAVERRDLESFNKLIIKYTYLISEQDDLGDTLLHLTIKSGFAKKKSNSDQFQNYNRFISEPDKDSASLHMIQFITIMLHACADPNIPNNMGISPLHLCSIQGDVHLFKELMNFGGNIEAKDKIGRSPLFLSVINGNISCVKQCIENGCDLFTTNKSGCNCLHAAVLGDKHQVLEYLLTYIISNFSAIKVYELLNSQDKDGRTAAHMSASCNLLSCLELLSSSHGLIDLSIRDRWQQSVWDMASPEACLLLNTIPVKHITVNIVYSYEYSKSPVVIASQTTFNEIQRHIIGMVEVQSELTWSEFDILIGQVIEKHCLDLSSAYSILKDRDIPALKYAKATEVKTKSNIPRISNSSLQIQRRNSVPNSPHDSITKSQLDNLKNVYYETFYGQEAKFRKSNSENLLNYYYSKESNLGLSLDSIYQYSLGKYQWSPGEYPDISKTKSIFQLCEIQMQSSINENDILINDPDSLLPSINLLVYLKSSSIGHLDELSYQSLIPLKYLIQYEELFEKSKNIMIHGPLGCGKTMLAMNVIKALQFKLKRDTRFINVCLHPSFKREDLLELLIDNNCISASREEFLDTHLTSSYDNTSPTPIILLDNINQVDILEIFGEFLTALEYRGVNCTFWSSGIKSSNNTQTFPSGKYYLREDCYFVSTYCKSGNSELSPLIRDRFSHIFCTVFEEPVKGILNRHFLRRCISLNNGIIKKNDNLLSCLQWISEIWYLYNCHVNSIQFPELLIGPRHFFSCPIDPNNWKEIYRWFIKHWNDTIVPFIDDELKIKSALNSDSNIPTIEPLISYILRNAIITTCQLSLIDFNEFYRSLRTIIPPSQFHADISKADSTFSLPGSNYKSLGNVHSQFKGISTDRSSFHEDSLNLPSLSLQSRSYSLILPSKNKFDEKKKRSFFNKKKSSKDHGKEIYSVQHLISQPVSTGNDIPESNISKIVNQAKDSIVSDSLVLQLDPSNQQISNFEIDASPTRVMQSEI